jgi:hypothetical protein
MKEQFLATWMLVGLEFCGETAQLSRSIESVTDRLPSNEKGRGAVHA